MQAVDKRREYGRVVMVVFRAGPHNGQGGDSEIRDAVVQRCSMAA